MVNQPTPSKPLRHRNPERDSLKVHSILGQSDDNVKVLFPFLSKSYG